MPVVLGMLFLAPPAGWSLFVLVIALVGAWEWSRLAQLTPAAQGAYLALSGAIGAAAWLASLRLPASQFLALAFWTFCVAAAFWIVVAPLWLARGWRPPAAIAAIAGWLVVWPTWFALVFLREVSPWVLLAVAALVWVADIAAYFAGRKFGKRKLAPAVSPGKTWEGVLGALAGVVVYGAILAWVANVRQTPLTAIFDDGAAVIVIMAMVGLTAVSIVGDLFESWMKRGAGLKDSSQLLPGHGGVLDRIDALTSTLPVAALALYSLRTGAGPHG